MGSCSVLKLGSVSCTCWMALCRCWSQFAGCCQGEQRVMEFGTSNQSRLKQDLAVCPALKLDLVAQQVQPQDALHYTARCSCNVDDCGINQSSTLQLYEVANLSTVSADAEDLCWYSAFGVGELGLDRSYCCWCMLKSEADAILNFVSVLVYQVFWAGKLVGLKAICPGFSCLFDSVLWSSSCQFWLCKTDDTDPGSLKLRCGFSRSELMCVELVACYWTAVVVVSGTATSLQFGPVDSPVWVLNVLAIWLSCLLMFGYCVGCSSSANRVILLFCPWSIPWVESMASCWISEWLECWVVLGYCWYCRCCAGAFPVWLYAADKMLDKLADVVWLDIRNDLESGIFLAAAGAFQLLVVLGPVFPCFVMRPLPCSGFLSSLALRMLLVDLVVCWQVCCLMCRGSFLNCWCSTGCWNAECCLLVEGWVPVGAVLDFVGADFVEIVDCRGRCDFQVDYFDALFCAFDPSDFLSLTVMVLSDGAAPLVSLPPSCPMALLLKYDDFAFFPFDVGCPLMFSGLLFCGVLNPADAILVPHVVDLR
ncbi:hypothetical protein Nepgr_022965 [Nepenthes gracilis]|uniref:Uncharacterized protein n=1 Tax=Nepenthes gracilis TaxID=150966 RepID=A0AAD3SZY4_NEPGR|nr:hypothetical protein Nepgr_022965 [Nepenthes gracilis]